jgi:predicted nicotinamide N-methyase
MREKIGDPRIDWKELALSLQKYRRKTVSLDRDADVVYLREMSIAEAGIGCAVWDAAIILARWFNTHSSLLEGLSVLELGAGVGLPGIVCARFASRVILSDYIPKLVENLDYNIKTNSNLDIEEGSFDLKKNVSESAAVALLDWHELDEESKDEILLKNHGNRFDIVFGSELVYTADEEHIKCLVRVVKRYIGERGVFYSIQSTDRDGMPILIKLLREEGFTVEVRPVDPKYCGEFGTKQRPESYEFYTAYLDGSPVIME